MLGKNHPNPDLILLGPIVSNPGSDGFARALFKSFVYVFYMPVVYIYALCIPKNVLIPPQRHRKWLLDQFFLPINLIVSPLKVQIVLSYYISKFDVRFLKLSYLAAFTDPPPSDVTAHLIDKKIADHYLSHNQQHTEILQNLQRSNFSHWHCNPGIYTVLTPVVKLTHVVHIQV